jgi:hypothetical protein
MSSTRAVAMIIHAVFPESSANSIVRFSSRQPGG